MTREEFIIKYGEKEGIRRWKNSEYNKRWRQEHRKEVLEYKKQYHQEHREERLEYNRRWHQENPEYMKQYRQEHRKEVLESAKQYRKEHQEERLEYNRRWHQENPEYMKQYRQTPYGRAHHLISSYRRNDQKYSRGDCTLTAKWMLDNIFNRSCLYCGESDWRKLGTDRIDNSKPHTPSNVVCSCEKCNKKRQKMEFLKFAYSVGAKDSDDLIIKY